MYEWMYEWMNEWINKSINGWMDEPEIWLELAVLNSKSG